MRQKPKKTRRSTSTLKKETGFVLLLKFGGLFVFASAIAVFIIVAYLDREIRDRLLDNPQSLPAHIYARPFLIRPDSGVSLNRLIDEFNKRGYRAVSDITEPGSYFRVDQKVDVHVSVVPSIDQPALAVRLFFQQDQLTKIVSHQTGKTLKSVSLEPLHIGSLHFGSYEDRVSIKLHDVPELLIQTLLAMEDRNFANHIGIDPKSIIRAFLSNLKKGNSVQGGSTLTQQLVKNLFLTPERSLSRKALEAVMAIIMEIRFSKPEILQWYLNEVFLGQSGNRAVHGFALGSKYYFGRSLDKLELHEFALLVGMIPAPSYYNPRRHPARAISRRNLVLKTLSDLSLISQVQGQTFIDKPLKLIDPHFDSNNQYPAYTDYLHRQVRQYYSEEVLRTSGLKLFSSLDPDIQRHAQNALSTTLSQLEDTHQLPPLTLQGAMVVIEHKTGEILALVGDRKSGFSGFNRAVDALRPIGSLVKPAVYLTALEKSDQYSLGTLVSDTPISIEQKGEKPWSPENYDKTYRGAVLLYQALAKSLNIPTVEVGLDVGVETVVETIRRLGVDRDIDAFPSTLLGANPHSPLEMAQLYQPIASGGIRVPLRAIRSVSNHRDTKIARFPLSPKRVIDPQSAFLIDHALQKVISEGTGIRASRQFSKSLGIAGKTGTTDNYRDSWFAGYSRDYLGIVWVGRDDNKPTKLSGSRGALPVWINLMKQLPLRPGKVTDASGVVFVDVDPNNGLLANYRCDGKITLPYVDGKQPERFSPCTGLSQQFKQWFNSPNTEGNSATPSPGITPTPVEEKNR